MNSLLDVQGLTPFFPQITRSTLRLIFYASSVIYFGSSNYRCDYFTHLQWGHQLNSLKMKWTWTIPEVQFLANCDLWSTKVFWTPCQHRRRQIQIQEPILVVHLYPAGQYSIHKIPSDNHKWRHESTNQMKFVDATSKIRVQKAKCNCEGIFGIKVRFGKQPFDCSKYEEIIYSFFTTR